MTTQALEQQTYLPESTEQMTSALSFLKAHEPRAGTRYFLMGAGEHDQVEMPAAAHRVLLQVLEAMKAGKAVTVAPQSQLLTTQQAADLLGVSRPTVVKLIDAGELPADTPGKRRRVVKLHDLLEYRRRRRDAQYRALLETSDDYAEVLEDAETAEERFRRIRAEIAAERRERTAK
ncbi:helix-turn-helix domain-containing protein [Aeromicrobium sp. CF4.19]|uniref:helix-turn-helix domain-containing protein n=1 Tax=Aeromicrobium sp. CF4.19 TaxID=3373082 RepID=UPI003EE7118B